MSALIQNITFHNLVAAPANGAELKPRLGSTVIIDVDSAGQGVAFAGKFQGKVFADGPYRDVAFKKLVDGTMDDDFIANGAYQLDMNGFSVIRAKLDAVANGTVTIKAREIG